MSKEIQNKEETTINIEAILKKQNEEFEKKLAASKEEMQAKIDDVNKENIKLKEELNNLKTNTAEENALLGQKIADIKGEDATPKINPYSPKRLYKVFNEKARITTLMTGDEVKGIIGAIDKHLTKKLIDGATEVIKFPYKITLERTEDQTKE